MKFGLFRYVSLSVLSILIVVFTGHAQKLLPYEVIEERIQPVEEEAADSAAPYRLFNEEGEEISLSGDVLAGKDIEDLTLPEVEERIREMETRLIAAQAEMFRARHRVTGGDEGLSSMQAEASALESELIETRRQYNEHLKIIDPDISGEMSDLGAQFDQIEELEGLARAIKRELAFAQQQGDAATLAHLESERDGLEGQIKDSRTEAERRDQALAERRREINERDARAGALARRIDELSADFRLEQAAVGHKVNESDEIKELDRQRGEWANTLDQLRRHREKLMTESRGPS